MKLKKKIVNFQKHLMENRELKNHEYSEFHSRGAFGKSFKQKMKKKVELLKYESPSFDRIRCTFSMLHLFFFLHSCTRRTEVLAILVDERFFFPAHFSFILGA